jgi:hemolysin activation/secretion protein
VLSFALFSLSCFAVQADEARFDILEYVVEGNTTLPAVAIETAVYPFLGERKAIADAESAREALEKAYHAAGYLTVFVNLPEQKVDSGAVRLRVTQGEVERLRVTGSRYYALGEIKARVPALAEGAVPYFPDVQKQLAGLGRAADRKVTPVLRPGREPGKVEVDLKLDDKSPLHATVDLNNRYSADTTHTRLSGSVRWDNLWQRDHSLALSYQVAPENTNDSKAISATYSAPLASGNYLAAYAVHTESDVASLGTLGVIGNGDILGLRYILPLRARPGFNHSLTLGADYKSFSQTVSLLGADSFNTPISYLPFTLSWDGGLNQEGSDTRFSLAANLHLRSLVGDEAEFANKRFKASSSYLYLRGSVEQIWHWTSGMDLILRAGFQMADQPLISNEGFALGGADTVRGYLESEVLGDRGLNLGLEWQSAPFAKGGATVLEEARVLAFVEAGRAWVIDPLAAQTDRYSLAGAGLGVRIKARGGFSGALDLAWPLQDAGRTQRGDGRVHARLGYAF